MAFEQDLEGSGERPSMGTGKNTQIEKKVGGGYGHIKSHGLTKM